MISKVMSPLKIGILIILVAVSAVSYVFFVKYQPKILKKIQEVKGARSMSDTDLLYPSSAEKVAFNQTTETTQLVYKTIKTQDQIQTFYKFLLTDLGWRVDSLGKIENSIIYKFVNDTKKITIMMQKENEKLLVSVDITKR